MIKKLLVFGACLGLFLVLYFKGSMIDPKKGESKALDSYTEDELFLFARTTLRGETGLQIKKLEDSLQTVVVDIDKVEIQKQLQRLWYENRLFGVSGVYAEDVADHYQTDTAWNIAGYNYALALYMYEDERKKNFFLDKAKYALEKTLEKNPEFVDAELTLASVYVDHTREPMTGILKIRDLAAKYPDETRFHMKLAELAFEKAGDYPKAINRLKKVLALDRNNKKALDMLFESYSRLEQTDSIEYYKKIY